MIWLHEYVVESRRLERGRQRKMAHIKQPLTYVPCGSTCFPHGSPSVLQEQGLKDKGAGQWRWGPNRMKPDTSSGISRKSRIEFLGAWTASWHLL